MNEKDIIKMRIVGNIYRDIKELSSIDIQKMYWLNINNNTSYISSYTELFCRLFDDNGFDDFVDNVSSEIGMSKDLIYGLKILRTQLDEYEEGEKTDEEVIEDFEWQKITVQAKKVLDKWDLCEIETKNPF